jgi:hypothetical protein
MLGIKYYLSLVPNLMFPRENIEEWEWSELIFVNVIVVFLIFMIVTYT